MGNTAVRICLLVFCCIVGVGSIGIFEEEEDYTETTCFSDELRPNREFYGQ